MAPDELPEDEPEPLSGYELFLIYAYSRPPYWACPMVPGEPWGRLRDIEPEE